MARAYFHVAGVAPLAAGSTEVDSKGFKVAVDATNGVTLALDRRFWSIKHSSKASDGSASAADLFYAHGTALPTADYSVSTANARKSIPIYSGDDELLLLKYNEDSNAVTLLAASGEIDILVRPNSAN